MLLEGSCKIKENCHKIYKKQNSSFTKNISIQNSKRLFIYAKTFRGLPMRGKKRILYWLHIPMKIRGFGNFPTNFFG